MTATLQILREQIEHAPSAGRVAPDLLGWWTTDGYFVCAQCIGRIIARGFGVPKGATPVWKAPCTCPPGRTVDPNCLNCATRICQLCYGNESD
jgi:hypothetical protein